MASIYKRGKTWWGRAQRKGHEYRKSLATGDRATAEKRLRKWTDELEAAHWGDRPRLTFAQAARDFIVNYLPTIKPSSAKRYGVSLKWLSDKFGADMLDEIGREELSGFETWRRALGASAPTIRRDLACLSSIFTFCEDREGIDDGRNPVPGYMRRRAKRGLKESPGRRRYLSEEEEARLLDACASPMREGVILSIDSGLRREELLSLTWPQIDFRKGVIHTTADTKNGRSRTVPLSDRAAHFLAQWREGRLQSFYVFTHPDGSRFVSWQKGFKGAVKRSGLDGVIWHDLRRTAACRWLQRDKLTMEEVGRLLGHHSVAVTEKSYAFLGEENLAGRTGTGTGRGGQQKKAQLE